MSVSVSVAGFKHAFNVPDTDDNPSPVPPPKKKWFHFDLFPRPGKETNYPFKVKCLKNKSCFASRAAAEGREERKQSAEMLVR